MHVNERELKDSFTRACLTFECELWMEGSLIPRYVLHVYVVRNALLLQQAIVGTFEFRVVASITAGRGTGMYTRQYRGVLNQCCLCASHDFGGTFCFERPLNVIMGD